MRVNMRSLLEKRHQRLPQIKICALLVQLLLATTILQVTLHKVSAAVIPEESSANTLAADGDIGEAEKRNWQQLQGAWGKRNWYNDNDLLDGNAANNEEAEELVIPEQWLPLLLASEQGNVPLLYQGLERLRSFDDNNDLLAMDEDALNSKIKRQFGPQRLSNDVIKRRNQQAWSRNRSAAYGKREPGWTNLKGMWGKRSGNNWQKLHGGWGKRSFN